MCIPIAKKIARVIKFLPLNFAQQNIRAFQHQTVSTSNSYYVSDPIRAIGAISLISSLGLLRFQLTYALEAI